MFVCTYVVCISNGSRELHHSYYIYQLIALRWHSEMIMGLFMNILTRTMNA